MSAPNPNFLQINAQVKRSFRMVVKESKDAEMKDALSAHATKFMEDAKNTKSTEEAKEEISMAEMEKEIYLEEAKEDKSTEKINRERSTQESKNVEIKDKTKVAEAKNGHDILTLEDITVQVGNIEKSVLSKDSRFMTRVIRALANVRQKLNPQVLRSLIEKYSIGANGIEDEVLLSFLADGLRDGMNNLSRMLRQQTVNVARTPIPEIEIYIYLLPVIYFIDNQQYERAVECSELLMKKLLVHNRRTMDMLSAKCYFYYARAYELNKNLDATRMFLLARLRTATLHCDYEGQATIINLLLRNYLHYNLFRQADQLVSRSTFPQNASDNEWARFHFYLGRIKATHLEYSEAHKHLLQAIRLAPKYTAIGFKQTVQRLAITVELLLGNIPERSVFSQPALRKTLAPYLLLTQSVRSGNLEKFSETLGKFGAKFQMENTFSLIVRLRHNVIKTGIHMICLSYSRISLADIAEKLALECPQDTEFIVAKAIRDGVIEATIDHEHGYVQSKETGDVYSTNEPTAAFHQRISFCLDIHNKLVKAMRFPPYMKNDL